MYGEMAVTKRFLVYTHDEGGETKGAPAKNKAQVIKYVTTEIKINYKRFEQENAVDFA